MQRFFRVTTRYGGGFVQSIDGVAGSSTRHDWFYYVNGVQAPFGAAATKLHLGDRVWWDFHDWRATDTIPAVVGSYPEPFQHGIGGRRYPVTLECANGVSATCRAVAASFARLGVVAATQYFGTGSGTDSLGVLVGTWSTVRAAIVGEFLRKGPSVSGVYARFAGPGGSQLQLLDPGGHVVRTLGRGRRAHRRHRGRLRHADVGHHRHQPHRGGGGGSRARAPPTWPTTSPSRSQAVRSLRCPWSPDGELPAAGQPPARRPRGQRLSLLPRPRPRRPPALGADPSRRGGPRRGRRRRIGARVAGPLRQAARFILPVAAAIVVINALVTRDGLTVILRLGPWPVLGQTNVTLEATVYGGVLALRAAILILVGALYTLAVDPDGVLRLFRRVSFRSALTATLATRLVPVLLRDSRRFADAQRCRPGRPPTRVAASALEHGQRP